MSVFIIGASGYIGNAVARAFQSEGYKVFGLVRSEDKAKMLKKQEITPIVGNAGDPSTWEHVAKTVDVIIEAMQDYTSAVAVQKALIPLAKEKVVIYTSGVWVYGNTKEYVDESTPTPNPPELVKFRPATEKLWMDGGAIVLRPGCVYGHSGSLTGMLFHSLKGEKAVFQGKDPYWVLVHVDDLAKAYVLTARKGHTLRGQLFNIISQSESIKEVVHEAARIAGYKGEISFVEPADPLSFCIGLSQRHINASKARAVLGWNPVQAPLLVGIEKYYHAATTA